MLTCMDIFDDDCRVVHDTTGTEVMDCAAGPRTLHWEETSDTSTIAPDTPGRSEGWSRSTSASSSWEESRPLLQHQHDSAGQQARGLDQGPLPRHVAVPPCKRGFWNEGAVPSHLLERRRRMQTGVCAVTPQLTVDLRLLSKPRPARARLVRPRRELGCPLLRLGARAQAWLARWSDMFVCMDGVKEMASGLWEDGLLLHMR